MKFGNESRSLQLVILVKVVITQAAILRDLMFVRFADEIQIFGVAKRPME